MYSVSADFLAALPKSHTIAVTAILTDPSTGGQVLPGMRISGGSVTYDRTAAVRRTCQVDVVVDPGVVPGSAADPLAPYGNRVQLARGIYVPATGVAPAYTVLVPVGVYRLSRVSVEDGEDGSLKVGFVGYDSSRGVSRNKFTNSYITGAGVNYGIVIGNLIQNRLPGVSTDIPATLELAPQMVFNPGDDPWDALVNMCMALGWECFFTVDDIFRCQPVPDPASTAVSYAMLEGNNTTLTDISKDLDDDPGYNSVIFTGESSVNATPPSALTVDNDPSSPTYYYGKYGPVLAPVQTSPFIATTSQAQAAGAAWLLANKGVTEQVNLQGIPNPALTEGDVVQVKRSRSKIDTTIVVQSITIPLDPAGKMSIVGAKRVMT